MISTVVVPWARISATRAPTQVAQPHVGGGTRRRDRYPDAASVVGLPRHPGGELRRAVAGEDEVAVAVDEAGQDGAAREVDTTVGLGGG